MPSIVRRPTVSLTLGGQSVTPGECSARLTKKNTSSTFSAKVPLSEMTAAGMGLAWIASETEIPVSLSINGTLLFTGTVDKMDIDGSVTSQSVSITGRDASKNVKDTKNNKKYINQTSQEVATDAAGQGGLGLNSDGNTVMTGRIYTEEQVKITNNPSNWQLLRKLGEAEGKVLSVQNGQVDWRVLDDPSLPVYPVTIVPASPDQIGQSSGITWKLGRDFNAAKKHTVNVKSWDHKKKQVITSTASSGSGSPEQTYNYNHHHQLTQQQADKRAKSKLKEHTRHEFDLTVSMPGDEKLTTLFVLALSGTNSGFDQNYNIDEVEHKVTVADGYRMTISTKTAKKGRNS